MAHQCSTCGHEHFFRICVGDMVSLNDGKRCRGIVRYQGPRASLDQDVYYYGIELDKPLGQNDGTWLNQFYFKCALFHGLFVRRDQISDSISQHISEEHDKSTSFSCRQRLCCGDEVDTDGYGLGIIRFIGPVTFSSGIWYGIELSEPKGDSNGCKSNVQYFFCDDNYGIFLKSNSLTLKKQFMCKIDPEKKVNNYDTFAQVPGYETKSCYTESKLTDLGPSSPSIADSNDENEHISDNENLKNKMAFSGVNNRNFFDDYKFDEIRDVCGNPGTFGTCFRVQKSTEPNKGKVFAAKRIAKNRIHHLELHSQAQFLHIIRREVNLLKNIREFKEKKEQGSRYILALLDVYENKNDVWLVTEFCAGGNLFDRIKKSQNELTEFKCAAIIKQVILAVQFLHRHDIVHLDLKPENIVFKTNSNNSVRIIDFGVSRIIPRLSKQEGLTGTPYYTAPEVFNNSYDRAADSWSCGVILFCMLYGYPPWYIHTDEYPEPTKINLFIQKRILNEGFINEVREGVGPWFPKPIEGIPNISKKARDLIAHLLTRDILKRFTPTQALAHSWLDGDASRHHKVRWNPVVRDALMTFTSYSKFTVTISRLFAGSLSASEINQLRETFTKTDINNDQKINYNEFCLALRQCSCFSEKHSDIIFDNLDINNDRQICWEEFLTAFSHQHLIAVDERLFDAFRKIDLDDDSYISKDDLIKKLKEIAPTFCDNDTVVADCLRQASNAIHDADINNDNLVDYQEFLRALHPNFNNGLLLPRNYDLTTPKQNSSDFPPAPKLPPMTLSSGSNSVVLWSFVRAQSQLSDELPQQHMIQGRNFVDSNNLSVQYPRLLSSSPSDELINSEMLPAGSPLMSNEESIINTLILLE